MRRAPLILTLVVCLAYGLLIPWLGFGWDDWNYILYATRGTPGLLEIFHHDGHIQSVWAYLAAFQFLGYSPLAWHSFALLLRLASVLSFWLVLKTLWPKQTYRALVASLLFAIYPILKIQIFPITYFERWLNYTFLFLSFYFTIRAVRDPRLFARFSILALAFKVGHVFTSEYTWFLELMRPVLIWIALPQQTTKEKLYRTTLTWLPYLTLFAVSVIWRGFFYTPLRKAFQVQANPLAQPLELIVGWALNLLPDLVIILFTSWYDIFSAEFFYLARPLNLVLLAGSLLAAGGLFYILRNSAPDHDDAPAWHWQAFWFSLPALLFGILPFYIAGYTLHQTNSERLAIATLPGAAIFLTILLEKLFTSPKTRNLFLSILVAFSLAWHLRYTNDFRQVWQYQQDFFQQLLWRAPSLQPGTVLYTLHPNPPLAPGMLQEMLLNDYHMAVATNAFYTAQPENARVYYWYQSQFPQPEQLQPGQPYSAQFNTAWFAGNSADALLLYYDPRELGCLRVLQPSDAAYGVYPADIRPLFKLSTAQPITAMPDHNQNLRRQLLGDKAPRSWCYFYQKAELAAQSSAWETIFELWQAAQALELQPSHGLEYLPFIQAAAHQADWETALALTKTSLKTSKGMAAPLCATWQTLRQNTSDQPEKVQAFNKIEQLLGCQP